MVLYLILEAIDGTMFFLKNPYQEEFTNLRSGASASV